MGEVYLEQLARPLHLAIIMDGNRRWADRYNLNEREGHRHGVQVLEKIVDAVFSRGIRYLTVFSFSTENWHRPASEVKFLLGLLINELPRNIEKLAEQGVRVRILGERDTLDKKVRHVIEKAEVRTSGNSSYFLQIAFNYGGQAEIVSAARQIARQVKEGNLDPDALTDKKFEEFLYAPDLPPADLIIRTSGEQRLSNFLLWQAAYSEFVFVEKDWPDFDEETLDNCLLKYQKRDRRYGARHQRGENKPLRVQTI